MNPTIPRALFCASLLATAGASQAESFDISISSDNSAEPTNIEITVHLPDSGADQFPVVLYSHGWGGSRASLGQKTLDRYLAQDFAVVSIDQRGHGASGGQANIEDPDYEGRDVIAVIDYIAAQGWSLKDEGSASDPVLFSIGGSYGGAYQWAGLLTELRDTGSTRFNGIAPEITWHDLPQSLAPNGVARTIYLSGLYGSKTAQGPQTIPDYIHQSYAYTMATGNVPTGPEPAIPDLVTELRGHSPAGYGLTVNVPALMRQGTTDTLFNMNQGYRNFTQILSDKARSKSIFVGHNGGHGALNPTALALGGVPSGDPCSETLIGSDFTDLTITFFLHLLADNNPRNEILNAAFKGNNPNKKADFHVASDLNNCISTDSLAGNTDRSVAAIEVPSVGGGIGSPAGVGIPVYVEIPDTAGLTVAGITTLSGTAYAAAAESRIFVGLAKGTSVENAALIQNQVMPIRFELPAAGTEFSVELAGIATELGDGEKLFLMVSAINDQFIAHGSRLPGGIVITDAKVSLPVQ